MKTHHIVILIVVVVIAALCGWNVIRPDATVDVIHPVRQTIRAYVEERAVTELPQDYLVAMPIPGWLQQIELREGDHVKQGDVVARLDTDDLRDRVVQVEKQIAVLDTRLRETQDHRLEDNALVDAEATVKAIDETVQAAEAKLEATRAVMEFAETEVQRYQQLSETNAATDRERRQAETDYRKARAEFQSDRLELAALKTLAAVSYIGPKFIRDYKDRKSFKVEEYQKQLEEAQATLEIQQRNLARAEIHSPIDSVVLRRHQTRRQFLEAGTPLLTLGQLEDMEITAEVLTERATRIKPGDPVEVFGEAIEDGPLAGEVLFVYPAGFMKISSLGVEQQRVKVAIKLSQRPPRLGVGFRVYVRIFHDEADHALTLPRTALFRSEAGAWQVMVVRDGRTELRTVTTGLMNDDLVQIADGLSEQDTIVAHPSREITAGMRVAMNPV